MNSPLLLALGTLAGWEQERKDKFVVTPPEVVRDPLMELGADMVAAHVLAQHAVDIDAAEVNTPVPVPVSVPVYFKPGEPQTLKEYDGQEHIVGYLHDAMQGLGAERALEPQLFLGPAGAGKTLLAKVIANELALHAVARGQPAGHFIEVFPGDLTNIAAFDEVMQRVIDHPGSTIFIDEVHDLTGPLSRKLYLTLTENRYLFHGQATSVQLPPTTLLSATTDAGALHPALRRRWIRHHLTRASEEQLLQYVLRQPFPIVWSAARLIVGRTRFGGAPWEALELHRMAVTAAKGRGASIVEDVDVDRVLSLQGVDELGLRWMDRQVIAALLTQPRFRGRANELVCYGASENDTCQLAGIDRAEYRETIKPRLIARGLLQVRPGYGQALTERAVSLYGA
jgi:Holliday junction DNA helicase RuvB